jgi:hypothetical protein
MQAPPRRYANLVTESSPSGTQGRGAGGNTLWRRYWASLTGAHISHGVSEGGSRFTHLEFRPNSNSTLVGLPRRRPVRTRFTATLMSAIISLSVSGVIAGFTFYKINSGSKPTSQPPVEHRKYAPAAESPWMASSAVPRSRHVPASPSAYSRKAAPGATTFPETAGGTTNTWTDYRNAGGQRGWSIPPSSTIQISCKAQGFRVQDGDNWWYRISSSPWNNTYYASADAFYNNARTSGSLAGTPYYDPSIPNC